MKYSTYHAHTEFCDGRSTAREMILAAIERGCPEIGLSSHYPLTFDSDWCMKKESVALYISELEKLREEYKKQIKVCIGTEIDSMSPPVTENFDYLIGSVHHVMINGQTYSVDASAEETRRAIEAAGCPEEFARYYFEELSGIYDKTRCNIIGHFDLLLKFNERDPALDTTCEAYIRYRDKALSHLLSTPAVLEVNTGAISRGYRSTPYPERDVLEIVKRAGKPVIVTSDSHSAATVDYLVDEVARELTDFGIHCIANLDELLSITEK